MAPILKSIYRHFLKGDKIFASFGNLAKNTVRQTLHNDSEKDDGKAGRENLTENKPN